jgi:hypothetical protein
MASPYAAGVTSYVGGVQYRASGAVKGATFGDGSSEAVTYDTRMRPTQYRLTSAQGASIRRYDYTYFDDGRLYQLKDLDDLMGDPHVNTFHYMSRAYAYDGQLVYEAVAGGGTTTTDYLVRSSVLGAVLTQLDSAGNKQTTSVPARGLTTAPI